MNNVKQTSCIKSNSEKKNSELPKDTKLSENIKKQAYEEALRKITPGNIAG